MSKRYNSVFDLSFSINHDNKDGSDLTAEDFIAAVRSRVADLGYNSDEWLNALGWPQDTYENEEEK